MAEVRTYRIEIVIDQRGGPEVVKVVERVGATAEKAGGSVDFLKKALLGVASVATLRVLQQTSDAYVELSNRLRIVSASERELIASRTRLAQLARDTRSDLQGTVELYARTAIATQHLGKSADETARFVELVNKAIAIGGATAREAAAGQIQFSQGLAANRLAGDELRSVLEGLPRLGIAIEQGLGVTRGSLRKLGQEGQLTANQVFNAIIRQGSVLDAEFGRVNVSLRRSVENVLTSFTLFIGQASEVTGLSAVISGSLESLAANFGPVAAGATAVAVGLAAIVAVDFGPKVLAMAVASERLAAGIVLVKAALGGVTLAGLTAGAAAAALVFVGLNSEVEILGTSGPTWVTALRLEVTKLAESFGGGVLGTLKLIAGALQLLVGVVAGGVTMIATLPTVLAEIVRINTEFAGNAVERARQLKILFDAAFGPAATAKIFGTAHAGLAQMDEGLQQVGGSIDDAVRRIFNFSDGVADSVVQLERQRDAAFDAAAGATKAANEIAKAGAKLQADLQRQLDIERLPDFQAKIEKQLDQIKDSTAGSKLSDEALEQARGLLVLIERERELKQLRKDVTELDAMAAATAKLTAQELMLEDAFRSGIISAAKHAELLRQVRDEYFEVAHAASAALLAMEDEHRVLALGPGLLQEQERALAQFRRQYGDAKANEFEPFIRDLVARDAGTRARQDMDEILAGLRQQVREAKVGGGLNEELERQLAKFRDLARKAGIQVPPQAIEELKTLIAQIDTLEASSKEHEASLKRQAELEKEIDKQRERGEKVLDRLFNGRKTRMKELREDFLAAISLGRDPTVDKLGTDPTKAEIAKRFVEENKRALQPLQAINEELAERARLARLPRLERSVEKEFEKYRKELRDLGQEGKITEKQFAALKKRIEGVVTDEFRNKEEDRIKVLGRQIRESLRGGFDEAAQSLGNFIVTGEKGMLRFSSILGNVASQLAAIAVQQIIFNPLARALGVKKFALGGVLDRPTTYITPSGVSQISENYQPEGVLPLKRGSDGRLGVIVTGAAAGAGRGGGLVFAPQMKVDVHVPPGTSADDAGVIGNAVANEVDRRMEQRMKQVLYNERRAGGALHSGIKV